MKNIAIIGSGISGLTASYLLSKKYNVSLFESNDYFGGHTHTHAIDDDGKNINIDTGFIVFNQITYPLFNKLLKQLNVAYQKSDMSFSVYARSEDYYYSGRTFSGLFAKKQNLINKSHWILLKQIFKFNQTCLKYHRDKNIPDITLGEFLKDFDKHQLITKYYVLPMVSAIWSSGTQYAELMPLVNFINFFANHKLFNIINRPDWYTIKNGSSAYISPILKQVQNKYLNHAVTGLSKEQNKFTVHLKNGACKDFDYVIMATNANQAKKIIADTDSELTNGLDFFDYSDNQIILHQDMDILPPTKSGYASWNYHLGHHSETLPTLTYYMNMLQALKTKNDYCVTVNPNMSINQNKIIKTIHYQHPIYDKNTLKGQQLVIKNNGLKKIYCCGAYLGNGFHEDGVKSAVEVAKSLGVSFGD